MFSYCLKWGKNIKNVDLKVSKQKMVEHCYYQHVLYVAVKIKIHERTTSKMNIK